MTFIQTRRPKHASGEVLEMYRRQEAHWGYVPNYAKVFSHRPEALARWGRLLAELRRPTEDQRFELVTLVAALEHRHSACSLAHGQQLARLLARHVVLALAEGREADVLPPRDVAIVRFVRTLARDASKVEFAQVEELRHTHGLADAEIFDIAAIAAARSFFTKLLDGLGCEPDVACMALDEPLREALTVGRPISQAPLEYTQPSPTD